MQETEQAIEREQGRNSIAETHAVMFKALANVSRIKIISLLSQHDELCVCELEAALGYVQSLTSYHLAILVDAGLITYREEGTWSYYKLNKERLGGLLSLQCRRSLLNERRCLCEHE